MTEPVSHYPGCWRRHPRCAQAVLESIFVDDKDIVQEHEIGQEADRLPLDAYGRQYPLKNALAAVGEGWGPLVRVLWQQCRANGIDIHQIKEKFGSLRFYVGSADEETFKLIEIIEKLSYTVCENCGEAGRQVNSGGWWKTLCENCEDVVEENT